MALSLWLIDEGVSPRGRIADVKRPVHVRSTVRPFIRHFLSSGISSCLASLASGEASEIGRGPTPIFGLHNGIAQQVQ